MTPQRPLMRIAMFLAAATAGIPSARGEDAPAAPVWREDYGAALEEARATGRLLWIQFTGPWCPNCVRMEHDSLASPAVVARANSGFIPVRLQADVHQELALSFDVTGLPASVIVGPDRDVMAVHEGYLGPEELDGLLGRAMAAHETRLASGFVGPPRPSGRRAELGGFCPVSLVADGVLAAGRDEHAAEYGGRVYRLADAAALDAFRRDPERFVPANDGRCPVERLDADREADGDLRFAALYRERLYLCSSEGDRERFMADPDRYAAVGVEAGGVCPHCLAERGEAVPGDPRYCLVVGGRRFWFPDESHRGAFLALAPAGRIRR
ncbi:thioredoxin family protein [Paludisphaera sp.]|uniref:thioredoxin family protein n=1 Tax=Paludisphaera sp. TaxID=2017432 RepID=UPI00301CE0FF